MFPPSNPLNPLQSITNSEVSSKSKCLSINLIPISSHFSINMGCNRTDCICHARLEEHVGKLEDVAENTSLSHSSILSNLSSHSGNVIELSSDEPGTLAQPSCLI